MLEEEFIVENRGNFLGIDPYPELDLSIPKLRNKYNNIKWQWRQRVDRAKNGSGLDVEKEAMWFQLLHPILSDSNAELDDISSEARGIRRSFKIKAMEGKRRLPIQDMPITITWLQVRG